MPAQTTQSPAGKKRLLPLVLALLVILTVPAWYYLYYIKTPIYSVNIIREAVKQHDVVKFQKHVDVDSVLARGYDDLIAAAFEEDQRLRANPLAVNIAAFLKQPVVTAFKANILKYVETGQWGDKKPAPSASSGKNSPPVSVNVLTERTDLNNAVIKGIPYIKKDGPTATVGLTVYDKDLDLTYVVDIKMRELSDGSWQATEVANLKDYLLAVSRAKKAKA